VNVKRPSKALMSRIPVETCRISAPNLSAWFDPIHASDSRKSNERGVWNCGWEVERPIRRQPAGQIEYGKSTADCLVGWQALNTD